MDEKQIRTDAPEQSDNELKEWQTPELIVEEVETVTQGGTIGDVHPVDDAWYS